MLISIWFFVLVQTRKHILYYWGKPMQGKRNIPLLIALLLLLNHYTPVFTEASGNVEYWRYSIGGGVGDGNLATKALLFYPDAVCFDTAGNLFIADTANNRVRKVAPNGLISTVAGNGVAGFCGDGGYATNAQLNSPRGLCFDIAGNLFIADTANNRIRKVTPNGLISTFAGNGKAGFYGDGGDAKAAQLNSPHDVACGPFGNIFITDSANNRIRKIDTYGVITTISGDGRLKFFGEGIDAKKASLRMPYGLVVDSEGNIFFSDWHNHRLRKIDKKGIITTIAGNGLTELSPDVTSTSSSFKFPSSLVLGPSGIIYFSESGYSKIRRIAKDGVVTTIAGSENYKFYGDGGEGIRAAFSLPRYIALGPDGSIYIADTLNNRVRKLDNKNIITTVAGGATHYFGDGMSANNASFSYPYGVAVGSGGSVYIADSAHHSIRKISPKGLLTTVAGTGKRRSTRIPVNTTITELNYPRGVSVSKSGKAVYVADTPENMVLMMTNSGEGLRSFAGTGNAGFSGDGFDAAKAELDRPAAIDTGYGGSLYIADTYNHRVRVVGKNGIINTVAGNGIRGYYGDGNAAVSASLNTPNGIAVDQRGNIYIADTYNHRVRVVGKNGIINTVAGNGVRGYSGDGNAAVSASLSYPHCVAVDQKGNIYIADTSNRCIRIVDTRGIISTLQSQQKKSACTTTQSLGYPKGIAVSPVGYIFVTEWESHTVSIFRPKNSLGARY